MFTMKYRVIHITPRSFLPEWSEAEETCFRSFASSCWYYAWVICSSLNRWGWVALIVSAWVLTALHWGNNMSYYFDYQAWNLQISFFGCLEEWVCHLSFERQHLTWDCQHQKGCPAANDGNVHHHVRVVEGDSRFEHLMWSNAVHQEVMYVSSLFYFIPWLHYEIDLYDLGILYESLCTMIRINIGG